MSTITPPAPATTPAGPAAEPPRGGRLALRVGAVITGLLVIFGSLSLFQLMGGRTSSSGRYAFAAPASALTIAAGSADVSVVSGGDGTLEVDRTVHAARGRTTDEPTISGGRLSLPGGCNGSGLSWLLFCSVSYVVRVPAGRSLDLQVGSGDITVSSMTSPSLEVRTGSGDVHLRSVSTPDLTARTGSGDIGIRSLTAATSTVQTGSGDLSIAFSQDPSSVLAKTGSGDLKLAVPRDDAVYTVHQHTGSGDYHNHLLSSDEPSTAGSVSRVITATTGSGDLTLGYTG
jgi:hypothetical protein